VLRVTTIHASSAGDSARYYTRYLADDGPDGEGRWVGRQAGNLGLSGSVSTEDLEALLSGCDPVTGQLLGTPLHDRANSKGRLIPAVAGFDATFSAPKSVSVLWALTGDAGWAEAHDLAVRAVVDHLEGYGTTTRVRSKGGRQFPDADGLIAATFRQATSREDDPQLHSHVVVSTKVRTNGAWYALDARYLKRKQRALGGLYQSVLRAELSHRYGVTWGPVDNGQAEITGAPDELLHVFSKRTAQVDAALTAKINEFRGRQGRDPTRWERAALTREAAADSRAGKTSASHTTLTARWHDEAAALGWTPARLSAEVRNAARLVEPSMPTVPDVLEQLSAAGSTWTRADILRAVCDLTPPVSRFSGRDWAGAVEQACDRVLAACTSLDPPCDSPVRSSDGRPVWVAPTEPGLTSDLVLAQEERVLLFAMETNQRPEHPSSAVDTVGLDILQASAARAVAGDDGLVLVVGPAGTGKTTMLRRAVDDLVSHGRPVFGVAPTAKAAKVLGDETGMAADTLAKLLHEWGGARIPREEYRLRSGATVVVDEAGMVGTGALDQLTRLAQAQRWRLVLVGDPRQLQAVGRGGMFAELCRTNPAHELATIHRFKNTWEHQASLGLRAGRADALDAYLHHRRVTAGTFDQLATEVAHRWVNHTAAGRTVAVVPETNDHVDTLNQAVQARRHQLGQLLGPAVCIAGGETASVGDIVVTRRNDRTLTTDRGEPVRNRDRWTITAMRPDGSVAVSHDQGHGLVTLPADYVRAHLRLGYAATAHGHQGDTVDISLAVVTPATTHRSLYVGATRGRDQNHLLVVAASSDLEEARDVLEHALANDRADTPAVAQRRQLEAQAPQRTPRTVREDAEAVVTATLRKLMTAERRAKPFTEPLRHAKDQLADAEAMHRRRVDEHQRAPIWRRRSAGHAVREAADVVAEKRDLVADLDVRAQPYLALVRSAEEHHQHAVRAASTARLTERVQHLDLQPPTRTLDRGLDIGLPGM